MSLKNFHLIFISLSIIVILIFAYWTFYQYTQEKIIGYTLAAFGSIITAVCLVIYEINFCKRVKA